ncbi:MAG: DNA repair protein RadA [Dehalococcoidia bacterium]
MAANPKSKTTFLCSDCGHTSPKWDGRCPGCGAWATYVEFNEPKSPARPRRGQREPTSAVSLADQPSGTAQRMPIGMPEMDRLMGGGIVPGSLMLIAGDPGVGKSTLLLQIASKVATSGQTVLYVSGEESGAQVRLRAERLGASADRVLFAAETDAEAVLGLMDRVQPGMVVVDSIQTLASSDTPSTAGSVAQVRDCAQLLMGWAKSAGVPIFLAGHVTKDGNVAGPRVLEHMVDVVMYLDGEALGSYRVLRCTKNRFGSTNDVALLEMGANGLTEVADPSAALIGERQEGVPGSAVVVTLEGTRALLSEVQALTNVSTFSPPRRTANGVDFNRMVMLAAVLTRRAGLSLGSQDIMVNVPGGLRLSEPAADLGVALSIASTFRDRPLDHTAVFLGEVGLNGEVRRVPQLERRLWEASRHGFRRAVVPKNNGLVQADTPDIEVVPVEGLSAAIAAAERSAALAGTA